MAVTGEVFRVKRMEGTREQDEEVRGPRKIGVRHGGTLNLTGLAPLWWTPCSGVTHPGLSSVLHPHPEGVQRPPLLLQLIVGGRMSLWLGGTQPGRHRVVPTTT